MNDTIKAAAAVLVALQPAAGALVPIDADESTRTRVQAAFEAKAPNTRRAKAATMAAGLGPCVSGHSGRAGITLTSLSKAVKSIRFITG